VPVEIVDTTMDCGTEPETTYGMATLANVGSPPNCETELYDSGATRHMTPYKEVLINYIGQGDLPICVPNGKAFMIIILHNVLHTPDIVFTLMSVGLIDKARYMVTFKGGTCVICDSVHTMVGCFPRREGLYRVDTSHAESASASVVDTSLRMTGAHWHHGHISPDAVQHLFKSGIITRIALHLGTEIATCDSCAYTKMTHKPVPKERSGK